MDIKVQHITNVNESDRRQKLLKLRAHAKSKYDYVMYHDENIVRYSSETPGAVLPQIYLDHIRGDEIGESIPGGGFKLLLRIDRESLMLIQFTNWEAILIDRVLEDTLEKALSGRLPIYATNDIEFPEELKGKARLINALNQSQINDSQHFFKDKFDKNLLKKVKIGAAFFAAAATVFLMAIPNSENSEPVVEEKPVQIIKKVRKDNFYKYKQEIQGNALYKDIYPALMTAALTSGKLPNGWVIEEVDYIDGGVKAEILHNGKGETTTLKYFRDTLPSGRFIKVDGQSASFNYPILNPSWFDWVNNRSDFTDTRDQFMDLMVNIGGQMRSNEVIENKYYQSQSMTFNFESVPIIYLELFNYIFQDKPIFIKEIKIKPELNKSFTAGMQITVVIIGT